MIVGRRKISKGQWRQFHAVIGKSGDVALAACVSKIGTDNIQRMLASQKYEKVQAAVEKSLQAYRERVRGADIGHRSVGRPRTTLSDPTKERFLYILRETGSTRAAASITGIATSTLYNLKGREPQFALAWEQAAAQGAAIVEIAGSWTQRQSEFLEALPANNWDLEEAAIATAIPTRLAIMLMDKVAPKRIAAERSSEAQATKSHPPSADRSYGCNNVEVVAKTSIELSEFNGKAAADRALMTSEMQALIDSGEKHFENGDPEPLRTAVVDSGIATEQVVEWLSKNLWFESVWLAMAINCDDELRYWRHLRMDVQSATKNAKDAHI